jgi:hypothetical protein
VVQLLDMSRRFHSVVSHLPRFFCASGPLLSAPDRFATPAFIRMLFVAALLCCSLVLISSPSFAQTCVGDYTSVSCGSNQFCCFNDPNNCGSGSSPCCSGGKACDANNVPAWTCSGQYACVALGAPPSGGSAGSYPVGLCSNTCIAQPPPNCTSQLVSWTVGSVSCEATVGSIAHGSTGTATDSTGPNTGSQNFACNAGTLTASGTGTCIVASPPADCAAQAVSWTVGSNTCNANVPASTHGQTVTATAIVSTNLYGQITPGTPKGTQAFVCSSGVLSPSGTGTCSATCSSSNVGAACAVPQLKNYCEETTFRCDWHWFWGATCVGTTTNLAGPQPAEVCEERSVDGQQYAVKTNWGLTSGPGICQWSASYTWTPKSLYPDRCELRNSGTLIYKETATFNPTGCNYVYTTVAGYPKAKPSSCPSCTANTTVSVCDWVP